MKWALLWVVLVSAGGYANPLSQNVSDDLARAILPVVCDKDSAIVQEHVFGRPACEKCPSFTEFAGSKEGFVLSGFYWGSFSAPEAQEAIAVLKNCEPRASGGGGYALLKQVPTGDITLDNIPGDMNTKISRPEMRWEKVVYHSGFIGDCIEVSSKQRKTRLVCLRAGGSNGFFTSGLSEAHLEADALKEEELFRVYSNDGSAAKADQLSNVTVQKFSRSPKDPRRIQVGLKETLPDKTTKMHSIELYFDGEHFSLSPTDKQLINELTQRSNWQ